MGQTREPAIERSVLLTDAIPHNTGMGGARARRLSSILKQNVEIIILVIAALILYLAFMSRSFDEIDAFNFALGLTRYDVLAHRPHPPGYPVYVFISSIPYRITHDQLLSLTSVSAVAGALTLIPTYAIARRLFNREVGLFSALALLVAPGFWLTSEQAVSDSLFTLLLMLALAQLLFGRQSKSRLYASWGTLAIALGVKPLNIVFIAPFLFETARAGKRRDLLYCMMILAATFLAAYLPAVLLTGHSQYLVAVLDQLTRHMRDDVDPFGFSAIGRFVFLLLTLASTMGASLPFRILPFYPFMSGSPYGQLNLILILIMSGAGIVFLRRIREPSKVFFLMLSIVPYFAFVYLLGAPGYSRYMIPILPLSLMTLVASALYTSRRVTSIMRTNTVILSYVRTAARFALVGLFVTSMFVYSVPLAVTIHSEPAPNIQLVEYVNSNYDPSNTTIVVLHASRAFEFFGHHFRYVHCGHDVRKAIAIIQTESNSSHTVLITNSAVEALRKQGILLTVTKVAEFSRNPLVNAEDHLVILYRISAISADLEES